LGVAAAKKSVFCGTSTHVWSKKERFYATNPISTVASGRTSEEKAFFAKGETAGLGEERAFLRNEPQSSPGSDEGYSVFKELLTASAIRCWAKGSRRRISGLIGPDGRSADLRNSREVFEINRLDLF
jgi:hypothetical protein